MVPLSDAVLGLIAIQFDRDDVSEHMLVLSSGWLKGKSFLRPGTLRDWTEIAAPKT